MSSLPSTSDIVQNWRIKEWFPNLNEKVYQQLKIYHAELLKFNKVVNLISSKTVSNADAIHFADSLLASEQVRKKAFQFEPLYDLGSGNGFPGLVYAILYPDQKVILVDIDERKCEFLKHVVSAVGILNVQILTKKIELFEPASIVQAICRGYAPLPRALLTLRKIVKAGGQVFHLKADEWGLEVSQIPTQLCSVWQPTLDAEYHLPIGEIKLYVVRTERIGGI